MIEAAQDILLAVLGPAGIWLGWHLQRRDKVHDRTHRHREIRREKAEAIYGEIVRVGAASTAALVRTMSAVQQLGKGGPPIEPTPPVDTDNLRALLVMYFPDSRSIVDKFESTAQTLGALVGKEAEDAVKNHNPEKLKGVAVMMSAKNDEITREFLKEIRSFMDTEVEKLI